MAEPPRTATPFAEQPERFEPTPEQRFQAFLSMADTADGRRRTPWWLKPLLALFGIALWMVILSPWWRYG